MVTPLFDEEAYWRWRREAEAHAAGIDGRARCEWCGHVDGEDGKNVGGFGIELGGYSVRPGIKDATSVMVETLCRTCAFWLEKAALPTLTSDGKDWTSFRFWLARGIDANPDWRDLPASAFTHLTAVAKHGTGGFGGGCYIAKFVNGEHPSKNSPFRYGYWHLPGVWSQGQPEKEAQGSRVLQYPRDLDPKVNKDYLIEANGRTIVVDPRPIATDLFACPNSKCEVSLQPVYGQHVLAPLIEAAGYGKVQ